MKRRAYISIVLDIERIRSMRESMGFTYQQAAEAAGFKSKQQWYNVESGTAGGESGITLSTLNAIAKALNCDPRDLLASIKPGRPVKKGAAK